jgi:uncharacterized protein YdiU (UPF0061 family)
MADKLGLVEADEKLVVNLFKVMEKCGSDFTNTFRALSEVEMDLDESDDAIVSKLVSFSAPKDHFIKAVKHQYHDDPKIRVVLQQQP